jgi:hypothetical protein
MVRRTPEVEGRRCHLGYDAAMRFIGGFMALAGAALAVASLSNMLAQQAGDTIELPSILPDVVERNPIVVAFGFIAAGYFVFRSDRD